MKEQFRDQTKNETAYRQTGKCQFSSVKWSDPGHFSKVSR